MVSMAMDWDIAAIFTKDNVYQTVLGVLKQVIRWNFKIYHISSFPILYLYTITEPRM